MAKASDIVKDATKELQDAIREIKQGDEEDLGELASKLDALAERADEAANLLHKANDALEGIDRNADVDEPQPDEEQNDEQQQDEEDRQ